MRRIYGALVTCLVAGLLVAPTAQAAQARVTVGGTNVITGSRTAYVPVRIPSRATVDVREALRRASGPNQGVRVSGRGPFVGVVITPDPPTPNTDEVVVLGRFNECSGPACPHGRAPINHVHPAAGTELADGSEVNRTITLAPGNYRLYLIADEGKATVRLALGGLRGGARLTPKTEAPGMAYRPEVRKDINTGGGHYGAGKRLEGGAGGIAVQMVTFRSENFQGADYGACLYRDARPPEQVAYGVQCHALTTAAGDNVQFSREAEGDAQRITLKSLLAWDQPGATEGLAAGVWYTSRGAVQRPHSQAFYLSFDDDAPNPEIERTTRYRGGKRITEWHYEGPAIGVSGAGVCTHPIHACAIFPTNRNESTMEIEIKDDLGRDVLASISMRKSDGSSQSLGTVCGKTEEPLLIEGGSEIILFPWVVGQASCPGPATEGKVVATFSR